MSTATGINLARGPDNVVGHLVYRKIAWRLVPLLMLSYVLAYLDRVNVGFAKLQMLDELKLSEAAYGFGAGLFFIGYLVFEVPSNLLMLKIGARKTLCRIMILWGVLSMGFAFVQTPTQFYILRILLGAAEAGFFPGIILFLTFWFPSKIRGKMTAVFYSAIPVSGLIGSPLSGWIMSNVHGAGGWSGWQWLFLIEGAPSVLLGLAIPFLLHDGPDGVNWLDAAEKRHVNDDLEQEARQTATERGGARTLGSTFADARLWHLVALCLAQAIGVYGISFWLPTILREAGFTTPEQIGLVSIIPFGLAIITINLVSRNSDRTLERRWHTITPMLVGMLGLLASTQLHGLSALAALTFATAGIYAMAAMFWTLPSLFYTGVGAAAAIGLINSIGGLGGFVSPYLVGILKDATGSTASGVYVICAILVLGALLIALLPRRVINR